MCESNKHSLAATSQGINYYILCGSDDHERRYGILASSETDPSDSAFTENLFFTKEEAFQCCQWLAENTVCTITLNEVLENFYRF